MVDLMIRRLFARRAEVAELRDRAVTDAATIERLRDENARLTGQLATHDQLHALAYDASARVLAHARAGCPCIAWDDGMLRPVRLIPDHLPAPYEEAAP